MKLTYEALQDAALSFIDRTGHAPAFVKMTPGTRDAFFLAEKKAERLHPEAPDVVQIGVVSITVVPDPRCPPGFWYLLGPEGSRISGVEKVVN